MPGVIAVLRSIARRTLPDSVRWPLAQAYFRMETTIKGPLERRFNNRPYSLCEAVPVLDATAFTDGPIVMVNNALAAGGVERQIVSTLGALDKRLTRGLGLLCLRLGNSSEMDFFKPAVANFSGFVRNAMLPAQANRVLADQMSRPTSKRMGRGIKWMPTDVQEEIRRFAAEFLILKPAVVHAWQDSVGVPATYAARMVGVPRIIISTRNVRPTNFAWYRPYMYYAYREIARCPEIMMINNSEAGATDYSRWLAIAADRFIVKRNGIETANIRTPDPQAVAALRAQLGIPAGAPVVGSIYRFHEEKRPLLWIEAASEIAKYRPDCHFVIFGNGPMLPRVSVLAEQHGIADRLHCPGTIADAPVGLSLFDVFLLTSQFEGTPNVVLEASILGIPVVATEAGGTREAIEQGVTGYLVEGADPSEIASRVVQILGEPHWRARVASEGPAFVERRFGLTRMVDETMALYKLPT